MQIKTTTSYRLVLVREVIHRREKTGVGGAVAEVEPRALLAGCELGGHRTPTRKNLRTSIRLPRDLQSNSRGFTPKNQNQDGNETPAVWDSHPCPCQEVETTQMSPTGERAGKRGHRQIREYESAFKKKDAPIFSNVTNLRPWMCCTALYL